MFNLERWQEIFEAIRKNKLRTFLTGLSVASGIFILVILLAIGQGMQNGVAKEFEGDATNRISVWTNVTSVEYKGLNPGRIIEMDNRDYEMAVAKNSDKLDLKSGVYSRWGQLTTYKKENGSYRVEGVRADYQFLENATLVSGRYINQNDLNNFEKNTVIGNQVYLDLFKGKNALGEYVEVAGIKFKVVGVYSDPGGEREETRLFIPLTTAQRIYNAGDKLRSIAFTLHKEDKYEDALAASEAFSAQLEADLKSNHTISPLDDRAVNVNNTLENAKKFYDLNNMIRLFFWGVGICTIIAGVVGVSNIMLIIVKERTKEIGIRKAIGAQPWSIIGMILHESIFVTAIAGFLGLIFSLFLLQLVGPFIETAYISNPSVDFSVAITTVIILVVAGAVAGFFPAYRAANIKPIEALRDE
ncbi:ABC-type antimicrobial peptide transport system, permease component [Aequorivita sublithincola DSM 14238]|uniref:ABC-type antimicrobial peptide transport system, permease component n=1 Tax=Aequorivita sublithincola (strain DSM 14238 / LMG 21431 / ACAM 643 / 9-3) TaxID=746697 RepID=I3YTQ0_AEQSU|nr:ABC transporter permease [Aequorivita sublithincola]AFL80368.1 ABC-type antimicrobial peptide transport system, permease component [Aequorivita sublithincola DSM 14238]